MEYVTELNIDNAIYDKHIDCNISLKKHQLTLLQACIRHENYGLNINNFNDLGDECNNFANAKTNLGIIADKVGSGKSFVVLSIIECNDKPLLSYNYTYTYGNNHLLFEMKPTEYQKILNLNMIVCSHGLIKQWTEYIEDYKSNIQYHVINSTKSFEQFKICNQCTIKIVLIAANFYKYVSQYFKDKVIQINRVFFDEVDTVPVPMSRQIHARFYWLVSASYANILYPFPKWHYGVSNTYMISSGIFNNVFVKNIFASLEKNLDIHEKRILSKIVFKNTDSYVEQSFTLPDVIKQTYICRTPIEYDILKDITPNNIINCIHAGDIGSAIQCLNQGNVNKEENIISIVKNDTLTRIQNMKAKIEYTDNLIFSNEQSKIIKIELYSKELEELVTKNDLLSERISASHLCNICFEPHKNKSITKCCKNSFCLQCICIWLKQKSNCPFCKTTLLVNDLYVVSDYKIDDYPIQNMDKYEKLEQLITEMSIFNVKRKILIFSNYDGSFHKISKTLDKLDISYNFLKGSGLNNIVHNYKTSLTSTVLLVNTKAYGSGLNLENTTDVIMFHKFDSQIEKQVIGRAQRPGRTSSLNIWYLLHEHENNIH